jgi:hypothetical protein
MDQPGSASEGPLLRLVGLLHHWNRRLCQRSVIADGETWQFRRQGRVHAFVQWLDCDGDDLLLQFVSPRVTASWDSELHMPTQISALLHRLVAESARARGADTGGAT